MAEARRHECVYLPGHPHKFAHLASWQTLNGLLTQHSLAAPRIEFVGDKAQAAKTQPLNRRPPIPFRTSMAAQDVLRQLRAGLVLVMKAVDESVPSVTALATAIEHRFSVKVDITLEARACSVMPILSSGQPTWRPYDVLILQVNGSAGYDVFGQTEECPLESYSEAPSEPPLGEEVAHYSLRTGDALYVPRGVWVTEYPEGQSALCLKIALHHPTGVHFVSWVLERMKASRVTRMDVPHYESDSQKAFYVEALRQLLCDELADTNVVGEFMYAWNGLAEARPRFGLPVVEVSDGTFPDPDTVIHFAAPRRLEWRDLPNKPDLIQTVINGQSHTFQRGAKEILTFLSNERPVSAKTLHDRFVEAFSDEDLGGLLNDLLALGLVTLEIPEALPAISEI